MAGLESESGSTDVAGEGGRQSCRKERDILCLRAGLLAKCDWKVGNELGSGTGDWHMEPQAVSDGVQGLKRSELMYLKKLPFIVA